MQTYQKICAFSLCLLLFATSSAQQMSLPQVEERLKTLAKDILYHDSLDYKIAQNKQFATLLISTLKRPESYTYAFDSLETVSILKAEDNAFRLFTWHIVDRNPEIIRGEAYHYYFGLVQRKFVNADKQTEYIVIPLLEMPELPVGVENMITDNYNWVGAQYYLPKYQKNIPRLSIKSNSRRVRQQNRLETRYTVRTRADKMKSDSLYMIGQGWQQEGRKRNQSIYLLFGWNGFDAQTNYKVVDIMSFDLNDKERVIFGAGIFFFDPLVAKQRAIFRYSDNAPFSLNMAYVKKSPLKKKRMIVYDHLSQPNNTRTTVANMWDLGPDGSYDALEFIKSGGYFKWYKDVELAEKYNRKLNNQQKLVNKIYNRQDKRGAKLTQKYLQEQSEAEQKRIKDAGIDLEKKGEKP
ncbi:MAG: hypothetical protein AAGI38_12240 [Bacteroidota bacterium]